MMGWSIGYDPNWHRDIGYGVPAWCDHPGCTAEIDRGLGYVCGNGEVGGGDEGCGLYFCGEHGGGMLCERCDAGTDPLPPPFEPKPDHPRWIRHKLTDPSWGEWRAENPRAVERMRAALSEGGEG